MTNEHVENALDWLNPIALDEQPSDFALRNAQIEASLALAYEQRTANLIALIGKVHPSGAGVFSQPEIDKARQQVTERLGLA